MTQNNHEHLGPAETILQVLVSFPHHCYHNRPGIVTTTTANAAGVAWAPASTRTKDGVTTVFQLPPSKGSGKRRRVGVLGADKKIRDEQGRCVGEFRSPGVFPEVVAWMWSQIVEVWRLDNEFAAKWASWAYTQDHRDLKLLLAAFMMVQSRCGEPVREDGEVLFTDVDYRDVGEAMALHVHKDALSPKSLLRIREILSLPAVAEMNHKLNFGNSDRRAPLGRWPRVVRKWLRFREQNTPLLKGLVKAGLKTTVKRLAQAVRYEPETAAFFRILQWKQVQSKEGHRVFAIGEAVETDSWENLTEKAVCAKIMKEKPSWKVIVGKVPDLTKAIVAAAVASGSVGPKDMVLLAKTFEEFGLLEDKLVRKNLEAALAEATDARARNVAKLVRSRELKEKLEASADQAVQKQVAEVAKNLRIYVFVDISGSMHGSITEAKPMIAALVQALPPDRVHVATFHTVGREITIPHPSTKGVEQAFKGVQAGGGTTYRAGVLALQRHAPRPEEDSLFIFIGDEEDNDRGLAEGIRASGLRPCAIGLLHMGYGHSKVVRDAAAQLSIPCFPINREMFADVYAVPRLLRNLIDSTPVTQTNTAMPRPRQDLIQKILATPLLDPPVWA